jgi:hypothetical protein
VKVHPKLLELHFDMNTNCSGLRYCFSCHAEEAPGSSMKKCSVCLLATYCDQACQRNHWREHKASTCKKMPEEPLSAPDSAAKKWIKVNREKLSAAAYLVLTEGRLADPDASRLAGMTAMFVVDAESSSSSSSSSHPSSSSHSGHSRFKFKLRVVAPMADGLVAGSTENKIDMSEIRRTHGHGFVAAGSVGEAFALFCFHHNDTGSVCYIPWANQVVPSKDNVDGETVVRFLTMLSSDTSDLCNDIRVRL